MNDETNIELGETYYPQKKPDSDDEIIGDCWSCWCQDEKYYYECDVGHFASKFKTIEISKEDFILLKAGDITNEDLRVKYELTGN